MMKKIIMNLGIFAVTLLLVTSCDDNYPIVFDESNIIIGLNKSTMTLKENGTPGTVNIYLGGVVGTEATDVVLEVSTEGISNPALEGTNFTLSSKNISVPVGETTVTITPIDNEVYGGNKQFKLIISSNSKNYDIAVQKTLTVTIQDNEHPLKPWIGTFDVVAVSYGSPGAWDEAWTITTSGGGSPTTLNVVGIAGGSEPVIATLDTVAMTIEIESESFLGDDAEGGYACSLYYGTDDLIANAGAYITPELLTSAASVKMTGTIEDNGTKIIKIDRMAIILDDYVLCWDVFNTTWTKR